MGVVVLLGASGCGGEDFDRSARRPPVPIQLSGVIKPDGLEVEPNRLGAGPIILLISNQTSQSHTVTLEGGTVRERVGPINPRDTAQLQAALQPGTYRVRAGSERAVARAIEPATLSIGAQRRTAEDQTELP